MPVSEFDSPSRSSLVVPFPPSFPAELMDAATTPSTLPLLSLNCPNIGSLPAAHQAKATALLQAMQQSLREQNPEGFNEAKRALACHLKKHGEPVTQWHPMVLELNHPHALKDADLGTINLEMVHLQSECGQPVSLAGTNLQSGYFLCANFSQVDFTEADLSGADLRFADLTEANLERATLVECNLNNAKLSFADFTEANLYCSKLNGATAKQARFQNANLRKTDLRHTDFYQSELLATRLQQADLREANLFMADLSGARLRQADLRKANLGFCRLTGVRLHNARLTDANLNNADLTQADLHECCLQGAQLSRTILSLTNLNATQLLGVDLSECCELEQAQLESAVYNNKTLFPKGFKAKKHGLKAQPCTGLRRISQFLGSFLG